MPKPYIKHIPSDWSRERKIQQLLSIADTLAQKWTDSQRVGLDKSDIYAISAAAIVGAVDDYDPSRGTLLTSHAMNRARQAVSQAVRSSVHRINGVPTYTVYLGHQDAHEKHLEDYVDHRDEYHAVECYSDHQRLLSMAQEVLTPRNYEIFVAVIVSDSVPQTAKDFGISSSRVHQIMKNATETLAAHAKERQFQLT